MEIKYSHSVTYGLTAARNHQPWAAEATNLRTCRRDIYITIFFCLAFDSR